MQIPILFENDQYLIVDKPAGVVVNAADSVKGETLQGWLTERTQKFSGEKNRVSEFMQKGGIVHRLDKDTSGVMVLAKTEAAYEFFKAQFLNRQAKKVYIALVHGTMKPEKDLINLPVERHSINKHKFAVGTDLSRMAITEYEVGAVYEDKTGQKYQIINLMPHTGRTHQLRVHLKHFNCPIVSDPIYGGKSYKRDIQWCPRLFLHAKSLTLNIPEKSETETFSAPLSSDLEEALKNLTLVV